MHIIWSHTSLLWEEELGARAEQASLARSGYVSDFDNQGRRDYQAKDEYVKTENKSQYRRKDSTLSYRYNLTLHHTNMEKLLKKKFTRRSLRGVSTMTHFPKSQGKGVTWVILIRLRLFLLL